MALRPARLLPPKRLLTPRSARRLSACYRAFQHVPGRDLHLLVWSRFQDLPCTKVAIYARSFDRHYIGSRPHNRYRAVSVLENLMADRTDWMLYKATVTLSAHDDVTGFTGCVCLVDDRVGNRCVMQELDFDCDGVLVHDGVDAFRRFL